MPIIHENPGSSVERTLAVLEAVADRSGGMSNADINRRLKIPKSSASYILRALVKINYAYHVGIEYEKDADDPLPGLAETVGYIRGALAAIE